MSMIKKNIFWSKVLAVAISKHFHKQTCFFAINETPISDEFHFYFKNSTRSLFIKFEGSFYRGGNLL